tara:strand:+ start:653 stop:925 length:273 start_codon:yes stop_codon:yes gene_type:complete
MINNWRWIDWCVPEEYVGRYCWTLWLGIIFIPVFLFGLQYTAFGLLVNFLLFDLFFYNFVKGKMILKEQQEQEKRLKKWRQDNNDSDSME